ncbi:MAG TPA: nuclear transport factor 2 family protein [Solirubrobacterales bacterium]|nr:nuclear transport factor 2 family protein [Solirubrobacterales bacterium]
MSADDNVTTVKAMYDAFGKGDVDTIVNNCAENVDWAADAAGDTAPWYGQRSGKDAVAQFFAAIADTMEVLEFTPQAFAATDDEVLAFIRYRARSKATGREIEMNLHHYWRFTDGKVATYRGSEDSEQTVSALSG